MRTGLDDYHWLTFRLGDGIQLMAGWHDWEMVWIDEYRGQDGAAYTRGRKGNRFMCRNRAFILGMCRQVETRSAVSSSYRCFVVGEEKEDSQEVVG
jgi:hypothetical protein